VGFKHNEDALGDLLLGLLMLRPLILLEQLLDSLGGPL
jgi:hypothetical protein